MASSTTSASARVRSWVITWIRTRLCFLYTVTVTGTDRTEVSNVATVAESTVRVTGAVAIEVSCASSSSSTTVVTAPATTTNTARQKMQGMAAIPSGPQGFGEGSGGDRRGP